MKTPVSRTVRITEEPVALYKILKFEGLAASGGEAKYLIQEGNVLVNRRVETRKRKKIFHGDIIEIQGQKLVIEATKEDGDDNG